MDTLEYRRLISSLDEQLERAKREAEAKQKREALEQHVKLVVHQITSFEGRKAEFEKFGLKPPFDMEPLLARLRGEKATLERQLSGAEEPPPVVAPGEYKLQDAEKDEVCAIADEVANTDTSPMPEIERWLLFEIWATRWRLVMERTGNQAAENYYMKRTYARIVETIKTFKPTDVGWFIDALDKAKSGPGYNWQERLDMCHRRLTQLLEARRKERESDEAETQAIDGLESAMATYAQGNSDETYRGLCHAIRQAARFEHLREDVAGMVGGWKDRFGEEFAFLWQNGKEEPAPKEDEKKILNREIVRRILHRLRSKGCIGASHAPIEKMWKGFPNHDQARAKEGLELLIKNGVIRRKNTGIGLRVSVESGMVARVDSFFQGKDMGIKAVDDWSRKEEA